jgi:hypothetical protein
VNRREIVAAYQELAERRRHEALRIACGDALEVWLRYRSDGKPIDYHDGVVGMHHVVDDRLPGRALAEVDRRLDGEQVSSAQTDKDYAEPIVAMQDQDLDFPGHIEQAYYAIYNLHQIVFRRPAAPDELIVLGQVASALDVDMDDWVQEWWTRVWDAWASQEPAYAPSVVTELGFGALCAWDRERALDALDDGGASHVRAVLLALAGRHDDAVAMAVRVTGATRSNIPVRDWLRRHVLQLAPEVIAVSPDETLAAVIRGERLELRDIRTGNPRLSSTFDGTVLRFVRFAGDNALLVAGDRVDQIGTWATLRYLEELDSREPPFEDVIPGRRTLVAMGPKGAVLAKHEHAVEVLGGEAGRLGDARVVGAAWLDDHVIATHDGATVALWDREHGLLAKLTPAAKPTRLTGGSGKVLVELVDQPAILIDRPLQASRSATAPSKILR